MVIIDAGHGGSDTGGGSNEYWLEKDLNLKIALYEYRRLKELGVPVALTRDSDITLNPTDRVKKALSLANGNNDILISNHINIDYGNLDGAEVIYSIKDPKKLANLIANNLKASGQNLSINGVYTRTNEYGNDYYYIIRNTRPIQSVLVEFGFADSQGNDVNLLLNDWEKLAEAIVKSVCEYLGYDYYIGEVYETHTVKKGDTLYSIAQTYGMTVEKLKSLNNLTSNTIPIGLKLKVYQKALSSQTITYVVKKGDTLYNIANIFNTTVAKIKSANNLTSNIITPGKSLLIPVRINIGEYIVLRGDTLYKIANKFNTSVELLIALNNLISNYIFPNQKLLVPR
jgi:LysM repeat protein